MEEGLVKRLITSVKCESCGQNYGVGDIEVLDRGQKMWFLKVLCSSCHSECLVIVTVKDMRGLEVATDLTEAEMNRFADVEAVVVDDVLDMHNFLKKFSGSFSRLLEQE